MTARAAARRGRRADGPVERTPAARVATQVQLAEFDGPLGLLLSLIEARQLDVLTVPLGALAEAYLDALGRARGRPARQRQLVRGGRQPADPDQEPGDAAAPTDAADADRRSPTRASTPRPSCAPG